MPSRKIWFKGAILPVEEAKVSVLSPTAQYGVNVFEGIRCYKSESIPGQIFAFRLEDHLRRLMGSAKLLGIGCRYSTQDLTERIIETIRANEYRDDTLVRLTLFVDGEGSWSAIEPVEMFISPIPRRRTPTSAPPALRACISTWQRINDNVLPPRVKAGANYINGRYAHLEARRQGCDVPLLLGSDGKLAEGAGACVFVYRDGVLATPPPTSSSLESITRATLIQLAREMECPCVERAIDRTELYLAEEVFLCGTAAEIAPIVAIDNIEIGAGKPGRTTLALLDAYHRTVSGATGAHLQWLTAMYPVPDGIDDEKTELYVSDVLRH